MPQRQVGAMTLELEPMESAAPCLHERLRERDHEAFAGVMRAHQQDVFRAAYRFFGNREEALEVVQETFLRLYDRADHLVDGNNLKGWLLRLCQNLCIDRYRNQARERRRREAFLLYHGEEVTRTAPVFFDDRPQRLQIALEKLPARQRQVFLLKHQEGLKLEEIARRLGTTLGTVKKLHHRAMRKLQTIVGPSGER